MPACYALIDRCSPAFGNLDVVGTTTYEYDPLHRLTQESNWDPGGDTYRYDENGNRVLRSFLSYTYDAADQMVSAGGISYGYDANGNQTSMGANTFTYDHEKRLTQSVIGGVTSSSTYNETG